MKVAWSTAKKAGDQSGWGLKAEDHSESQQIYLAKKCPFFNRLDEIWGTRANSTSFVLQDTSEPMQKLRSFATTSWRMPKCSCLEPHFRGVRCQCLSERLQWQVYLKVKVCQPPKLKVL